MRSFVRSLAMRRVLPILFVGCLCCLLLGINAFRAVVPVQAATNNHVGTATSSLLKKHFPRLLRAKPLDDAGCQTDGGGICYTPQQIQNTYNLTYLLDDGINGTGQTIVIVDSYGSPTIKADLKTFDTTYNLPDPPSFKVLSPLGTVPFDPSNTDQVGWAEETSLDVQWAHVLAPHASIVLLTSPVDETEGVQGLPQFLQLEEYAVDHHLGSIISQSWSATEETLFTPAGKKLIAQYEAFYQKASAQGITFLAATGDSGVLNPDTNGNNYPFKTVGFPASSPWVTAVGGTSLYLNSQGTYQSETVWNEGLGNASGGGFSSYFREPDYQKQVIPNSLSGGFRGLPDVSFNADPDTGIPVYLGFLQQPGFYVFGGTSAAAPQWAGLIADGNQLAHHALGFLNPKLYQLGQHDPIVYHDITVGNNSQGNVTGYNAVPGWDAATGWGSPNAAYLLINLSH